MADELCPESLIKIFYKFPLSVIPIVNEIEIKGFISKEKTLRQANASNFFSLDFANCIRLVLEYNSEEILFQEIDNLALEKIPVVDSQKFTLKIITGVQFFSQYRPVDEIIQSDFKDIIDSLDLPVFIFNTKNILIYKNKAVRKLKSSFSNSSGNKRSDIMEFFPSEFFNYLEAPKASGMYTMKSGEFHYKYRVQQIEFKRGLLNCVYFISASDNSI